MCIPVSKRQSFPQAISLSWFAAHLGWISTPGCSLKTQEVGYEPAGEIPGNPHSCWVPCKGTEPATCPLLAFTVSSIVMFPVHLPYCLRAFRKTILNIANLSHIFPNISRMPAAPWINIDMAEIIKNIPITNPKPNRWEITGAKFF